MKQIQKVTLKDVAALQQISRETFADAFGAQTANDDLSQYLDAAYATDKLRREIEDPASQFYFMFVDDQLAGYLKLNVGRAQTELKEPTGLEVERIYIRDGFQRRGLGQQFIQLAIDQATKLDKDYVWLGVWEHNQKGIAFYHKMGFMPFSEHVFQVGDDPQRDVLMKKSI